MTPARLLAGLTAVAVTLGACGSETTTTESAATDSTSAAGPTVSSDATTDSTSASDPTTESAATDSTVSSDATTTSTTSATVVLPPPVDDINLVEVCTAEPYNADGRATSGEAPPADEPVVLLDRAGSHLCLGAVVVEGRIVESATAAPSTTGGFWIELVLTPAGIGQFNQVAALCFAEDPDLRYCPSGRLAMVNGSTVASSPTINAHTFERDQIIISGNFTEAEAADLASAFVEDGMVLRPVIVDLGT